MSVQAYFQELEAVVDILESFVKRDGVCPGEPVALLSEEEHTAIWQAAELLARAYSVLVPLMQLDLSKQALNVPDAYDKPSGLVIPGAE